MRKLLFIALCLLSLASCTKKSSTTGSSGTVSGTSGDTTFDGNYFNLSYGSKNVSAKGLTFSKPFYYATAFSTYLMPEYYQIVVVNDLGIGGLSKVSVLFRYNGTGTGSFPLYSNTPAYTNFLSNGITYFDSTGSVTISHNGTDYLQGTFSGNLYGSGLNIPATGSFKIIR